MIQLDLTDEHRAEFRAEATRLRDMRDKHLRRAERARALMGDDALASWTFVAEALSHLALVETAESEEAAQAHRDAAQAAYATADAIDLISEHEARAAACEAEAAQFDLCAEAGA